MLLLSKFDKIPPSAQFISNREILGTTDNLANFDHSMMFRLRHLLFSQIGRAPSIIESYFPALSHIEIDKIKLLIVFMSEIHGIAIPKTKEETLCLLMMILKNSNTTVDYSFYLFQLY